jgi:hypothetical protein
MRLGAIAQRARSKSRRRLVRARALLACAAASLFPWAAPSVAEPQPAAGAITATEARAIARDAYVYGFPLVDNYRVLHSYFVDRGDKEFKAPWNTIHNEAHV